MPVSAHVCDFMATSASFGPYWNNRPPWSWAKLAQQVPRQCHQRNPRSPGRPLLPGLTASPHRQTESSWDGKSPRELPGAIIPPSARIKGFTAARAQKPPQTKTAQPRQTPRATAGPGTASLPATEPGSRTPAASPEGFGPLRRLDGGRGCESPAALPEPSPGLSGSPGGGQTLQGCSSAAHRPPAAAPAHRALPSAQGPRRGAGPPQLLGWGAKTVSLAPPPFPAGPQRR